MTATEQIVTIGVMALAVMVTRFVSFLVFPSEKSLPPFVRYLGTFLPSAVFGMLVVYCLRSVDFGGGWHGLPELLGVAFCVVIHLCLKNMMVTIAGGTLFYMLLVQCIF